jgi:hypothetical protein
MHRLLLAALVSLLIACGGSSSETPWPVEPYNTGLGPAGETAPAAVVEDNSPSSRGEVPPAPDAGAPVRKRP